MVYLIIRHLSPELQQELFSSYPHAFLKLPACITLDKLEGLLFPQEI